MSFPRFDRLATLYCVAPALKLAGVRTGISILMYHRISDDPEPNFAPYYRLNTPPALFEEHLRLLVQEDSAVVSLGEAFSIVSSGQAKRNAVVITFDDGYESVYTEAFPRLRKFGFPATVFLPTAYISDQRLSFNGTSCLTWNEVAEMSRNRVSFGSHTESHPKLVECSGEKITSELFRSKDTIENRLGTQIDSFAYPYAFPQNNPDFIRRFKDALESNGYKSCCTTKVGRVGAGDNPFELKRLPVNSCDDASLFLAKLNGAYDWVGTAQALRKASKRLLD